MTFAETDNHSAENSAPGHIDALAALIGLARMSRLNLLHYHRDEAQAGSRLLLHAARQRGGNEIVVLFDEWDGAPLPMLQQRLDEAVHAADPGATPYFGDLPGALAHWQHEQGLRFFVILYGFERHLARNAEASDVAEFDRALIRLASDPMLELHILLCIEEEAAPMLDRLRPFLPDLGQDYLCMPELPEAAPSRAAARKLGLPDPNQTSAPAATPSASRTTAADSQASGSTALADSEPTLPILPLSPLPQETPQADAPADFTQDTGTGRAHIESVDRADKAVDPGADRPDFANIPKAPRRRRDFSALLETLDAAPLAQPKEGNHANAPQQAGLNLPRASSAEQPTRVSPWLHDHIRRRRLTTLKLATTGILASTAIVFVLLVIGMLAWTTDQAPGNPSAAASARELQ